MLAYDVDILKRPARRGAGGDHGWCFGLPPGIAPHQWPLDPNNGYPLMHGFTLLLPEDYRCHGSEIVAVSFFATAFDHNDGGPLVTEGLHDVIAVQGPTPPTDPLTRPFWDASLRPHLHLHRMRDALDCDYAVILLTQAEFDGDLCRPPPLVDSPLLDEVPAPRWLTLGGVAGYAAFEGHRPDASERAGYTPEADIHAGRALAWRPRPHDPNAGRIPTPKAQVGGERGDYEHPEFRDELDFDKGLIYVQDWANELGSNHIGGTMQPWQDVPAFSPYYIEFWESFGGYNFGGGNAQLDFRDMKFDWACG